MERFARRRPKNCVARFVLLRAETLFASFVGDSRPGKARPEKRAR